MSNNIQYSLRIDWLEIDWTSSKVDRSHESTYIDLDPKNKKLIQHIKRNINPEGKIINKKFLIKTPMTYILKNQILLKMEIVLLYIMHLLLKI